jgi:hypothetical protein
MHNYTDQSEATRVLAAGQTHSDMHVGHGVIAAASHDAIARRAYDIYVKSGCKHGHCAQNWQQAEHELKRTGHRA